MKSKNLKIFIAMVAAGAIAINIQANQIMENSENSEIQTAAAGTQKIAAGTPIADALSLRERHFASTAAPAALGDMANLEIAFERALDDGVPVNELKEICVQLYAYCGFPRALNALNCLMKTVRSREIAGKKDVLGNEPTPPKTDVPALEIGTKNQTKLCGAPVKGELFEFAPAIDQFLKAHLFGDIFARDNLAWREREIATVAALAAMAGVESQRDSHIRIAKHNGVSESQIAEILKISAAARVVAESTSRER